MLPWFSSSGSSSPSPSSSPQKKRDREHRSIRAVVVHSHSGGKRVWDYLGKHWNEFGAIKLSISHQREFNLESLVKAAPDVVVCSDPAGAPYQYSPQEVADIQAYMTLGVCRHIIGTYATFYHQEGSPSMPHIYDNRKLASLFGLDPNVAYTTKKLPGQPKYDVMPGSRDSILWKDVGMPYCTWGYSSTQIPVAEGGLWVCEEAPADSPRCSCPLSSAETSCLEPIPKLPGADVRVLAKTSDNLCVVLNHVTDSYSSLYISHMPEYESLRKTKADVQFLYNCFVFLVNQGCCLSLTSRCIDLISRAVVLRSPFDRAQLSSLPTELQERIVSSARLTGKADERRLHELFSGCPWSSDRLMVPEE